MARRASPVRMLGFAVLAVVGLAAALVAAALAANRVPLTRAPGVTARLAIYFSTNVAQTGPDAVLEELRPVLLATRERAQALERIAAACRALGWHAVRVERAGAGSVHAEVVSRWLRFTDDVTVTLADASHGALEARVRSASRVGRGDLGANARHVMDLRDALARAGALASAGG